MPRVPQHRVQRTPRIAQEEAAASPLGRGVRLSPERVCGELPLQEAPETQGPEQGAAVERRLVPTASAVPTQPPGLSREGLRCGTGQAVIAWALQQLAAQAQGWVAEVLEHHGPPRELPGCALCWGRPGPRYCCGQLRACLRDGVPR